MNLAARLMTSPDNPGILVDNAVRLQADKSYAFDALMPVNAKGYSDPVPIFEPLSATEKRWGKVRSDIVGRVLEMSELVSIVRDLACKRSQTKLVFLSAASGTGKSALLVQTIGKMRRMGVRNRRSIIIIRNVSNDGDHMIPFR